jgi:uncharacterized membrane protein
MTGFVSRHKFLLAYCLLVAWWFTIHLGGLL